MDPNAFWSSMMKPVCGTCWFFGLTDRGYHVVPASSGEEGVEKAKHAIFDLMVCDIMMPGKDGVTVLKEIKSVQPDIEVVMATGYAHA